MDETASEATEPQKGMPPEGGATLDHIARTSGPEASGSRSEAEAGELEARARAKEPGPSEGGSSLIGHLAGVAEPVASALEPIVSAVEPVVGSIVMPFAGAIGTVIDAATSALRRSPEPLANLFQAHPEAREASPRELGFRFVPIEEIRGTAVAGAAQRGTDFLPLPAFRGANWAARWQRIRDAHTDLKPLPPVDLIKYDGGYWVVDGHNRVAATIQGRGVGVDAMVIELVPLDAQLSELPSSFLPFIGEVGALRTAVAGRRPAADYRLGGAPSGENSPVTDAEREAES